MISLKSYLYGDSTLERETQYRRIINLFLQGIGLHAIEADKGDYNLFRIELNNLEKSLTADIPLADVFVIAGSALRVMEDYNHRAEKVVRRHTAEYQLMVSMLTNTVVSLGASSDESAGRLQTIEKSLERASSIEDFQSLKTQMAECLEMVRVEASRQKAESETAIRSLQHELEGSRKRIGSTALPSDIDLATGLPGKKEASSALQLAAESPRARFLVIAVVSRVQAVNARFGYAVGDRVLATFAEHFQKGLTNKDKLYRWQGPSLMALLERPGRIEQVRTEVRSFTEIKLEKTFQIGMRSVLIPISCSWAIFPMESSVDSLMKKIETFTAAQIPRDFV